VFRYHTGFRRTTEWARRFEVYGSRGSAILEPFEPAGSIRLCLLAPAAGFAAGEQRVTVPVQSRQALYEAERVAFLDAVRRRRPPDGPLAPELPVQETSSGRPAACRDRLLPLARAEGPGAGGIGRF
jgi:predicted dehydrogenase